ncbi:MAG: transposase, partial [Candidatus Limnocylindrales bacterium]
HRGHARVEDRVRCWKDCGLQNLPFASFTQNLAWVATSLVAGALIAWMQMTCLDGELKKAEPKTIRNRLLHVAATLVRHGRRLILRLDETWPWAETLRRAFLRLRTAFRQAIGRSAQEGAARPGSCWARWVTFDSGVTRP